MLSTLLIANLTQSVHAKNENVIIQNDSTCKIVMNTSDSYSGKDITAPKMIDKMSKASIYSFPYGKLIDVKTISYHVMCGSHMTQDIQGEIDITFSLGNYWNDTRYDDFDARRVVIDHTDNIVIVKDAETAQ